MCSAGTLYPGDLGLSITFSMRVVLETTTFLLNALQFVELYCPFLNNQTVNSTKIAPALLAGRCLMLSTEHSTLEALGIMETMRT